MLEKNPSSGQPCHPLAGLYHTFLFPVHNTKHHLDSTIFSKTTLYTERTSSKNYLVVTLSYGVIRVSLLTLYRVRTHAACLIVHGSMTLVVEFVVQDDILLPLCPQANEELFCLRVDKRSYTRSRTPLAVAATTWSMSVFLESGTIVARMAPEEVSAPTKKHTICRRPPSPNVPVVKQKLRLNCVDFLFFSTR